MNNSLRTKLIVSYLLIAILTAGLIYALIRVTSNTRLKSLILEQQLTEINEEVVAWYQIEGNWEGFDDYYRVLHPPPSDASPTQNQGSGSHPLPPPPKTRTRQPRMIGAHGIVSVDGVALIGFRTYSDGNQIPQAILADAVPVDVQGETVAYIVPDDESGISLAAEEQIYLERTNQVLSIAGLAAIGGALLGGLAFAQVLIRPIRELTEASRKMAEGDLEQRVPIRSKDELGELGTTFNQMSADLADATRQRKQMTADIAHDLGTPLQVISGYVEGMQDGTLPATEERLGVISAELTHLRRLVEDLDLLAQTDTRTLRLKMESINTHDFLTQVAQSYLPMSQAQEVMIETDLPAVLPPIEADYERLMQVLGNLVTNALRYTPPQGAITLSAKNLGNRLLVQVKDTGVGIAKDDLPHVFDRFYRADQARTEGGKMGLGLAISKALIEAMGGEISAETNTPTGTIFNISLQSI